MHQQNKKQFRKHLKKKGLNCVSKHNITSGLGIYGVLCHSCAAIFHDILTKEVYKLCYSKVGQLISVCNYWNDPYQHELYLSENDYLPYLNNEIKHENSNKYKENFSNLTQLVLVGGPDDAVIQPWQSAQYSYWDKDLNVIPYNQLDYYTGDLFGLKTLDEQGKITFCTVVGVRHSEWVKNKDVYEKCIRPYLG